MKHRSNRVKRYARSARTMQRRWLAKLFSNLTPLSLETTSRTLEDHQGYETFVQYGLGVEAFAKKLLDGMAPQVKAAVEKGLSQAMANPALRKLVLNTQTGAHAAAVPALFNKAEHERLKKENEQ